MYEVIINAGDIIKLAPRDPAFWMLNTGMVVVESVIPPDIILGYDGVTYNLHDFLITYLNGRDLTDMMS